MVKEYCDKCRKEIVNYDKKKTVEISFPDGYSSRCAKVTLCNECFESMEISSAVKSVGHDSKTEKEPATVEKLMDIIRELVAECLEE